MWYVLVNTYTLFRKDYRTTRENAIIMNLLAVINSTWDNLKIIDSNFFVKSLFRFVTLHRNYEYCTNF